MTKSVYDELRDDIISGTHPAGIPLVEQSLARQYGVSRTPVREALLQLLRDGLVSRTTKGLAVASHTAEEVLEIYEVRVLLEEAAARWAAARATELDISRMRQCHAEMKNCSPTDYQQRAVTNIKFHELLWRASHNATLVATLERMILHLHRFPDTTIEYPGRWQSILEEHEQIIDALVNRDAQRAAQLAADHMEAARVIRLEMSALYP